MNSTLTPSPGQAQGLPLRGAVDSTARRVTQAFLLGWSVSETLGLVRRGTRRTVKSSPPSADYAPRLAVSDGSIDKSADALILATDRLVQFWQELGFETGDNRSPLTLKIYDLPEQVEAWLTGQAEKFYTAYELREVLNAWSLQVWARLNAESAESARAFTAGMSLADTYWYQRPPLRRPKDLEDKALSEENWRRLLSPFRLAVERRRLKTLESDLPPYVVAVISRHLTAWSIGNSLGYAGSGPGSVAGYRLALVPAEKQSEPLKPADEQRLQEALVRQMQNWEAMLFGLREATSFLRARDVWLINAARRLGLFLVLLATAFGLVAITLEFGLLISLTWLPSLVRLLNQQQAKVGDYLAVVSLMWTILIAAPVPFVLRSLFQATRTVQVWLDSYLKVYFIARRTYVPWDRYFTRVGNQK